jgi:hypothetical protein
MTLLTPSAIKKVKDALSSSSFSLADFNIHLPESGSCFLQIDFMHREGYEFKVIENKQKSKVKTSVGMGNFGPTREEINEYTALFTRETPGSFKMQDQIEIDEFDEAMERIMKWCQNVRDNLAIMTVESDTFAELRETIEEQIKECKWSDEERFSNEEIVKLNSKLDDLSGRFEKMVQENRITQKDIDQINSEIAEIKGNAKAFPKKIWARVTGNKLIEIMTNFARSQEGRQLVAEGIKKLISMSNSG